MTAPFARVTTTSTYILLDVSYSNSLRLEKYSIPHSVADVSSRFASTFVIPPAPLPSLFFSSLFFSSLLPFSLSFLQPTHHPPLTWPILSLIQLIRTPPTQTDNVLEKVAHRVKTEQTLTYVWKASKQAIKQPCATSFQLPREKFPKPASWI